MATETTAEQGRSGRSTFVQVAIALQALAT